MSEVTFDPLKDGVLTNELIFLRFVVAEILKSDPNADQVIDRALDGARRYPLIGGTVIVEAAADRLRELLLVR